MYMQCHAIPSHSVPPQIVSPLHDVEVEMGHNITLTCTAEGTDILDITWKRGDSILVGSEHLMITSATLNNFSVESMLLVSNAELEDTGNYSCTASNVVGNDTITFHLFVTGETDLEISNHME